MQERDRVQYVDYYLDLAEQMLCSQAYADAKAGGAVQRTIRQEIADLAKASVVEKYPTLVDAQGEPLSEAKDVETFANEQIARNYRILLHRDLYDSESPINGFAWEELAERALNTLKDGKLYEVLVRKNTQEDYERQLMEDGMCAEFVFSYIRGTFLNYENYRDKPDYLDKYLLICAKEFLNNWFRELIGNRKDLSLVAVGEEGKEYEREFVSSKKGSGLSRRSLTPEEAHLVGQLPADLEPLWEEFIRWKDSTNSKKKNGNSHRLIFELERIGVIADDGIAVIERPNRDQITWFLNSIRNNEETIDRYFELLRIELTGNQRQWILDTIRLMPKNLTRHNIDALVSRYRQAAKEEFEQNPVAKQFLDNFKIGAEYERRYSSGKLKAVLVLNLQRIGVIAADDETIIEDPNLDQIIWFLNSIRQDENNVDRYFELLNVEMTIITRERVLNTIRLLPKDLTRDYLMYLIYRYREAIEKEFKQNPTAEQFLDNGRVGTDSQKYHPSGKFSVKERNDQTSVASPPAESVSDTQDFKSPGPAIQ